MKTDCVNEELMIQYLLGELSEQDCLDFEQATFENDQLFEELLAVEAELTDDYVRGLLTEQADAWFYKRNVSNLQNDPTTRLEYDLFNWAWNGKPIFVHTFAREQHGAGNPRWQESFTYSDGVGREVMKKIQAEPGKAKQLDAAGNIVDVDTSPNVRWVGTGRVVFDNKGNPVKKYEPFFSATRL